MVRIGANVSGFTREINRGTQSLDALVKKSGDAGGAASTSLGRLAQSARLQSAEWTTVGTTMLGVGAAITGIGALAVREFASFDQAMSGVASTGADAKNNIDALREAAIDAGADTAFSATEAANGLEELARAGVSAKDALAGGLTGSLDLAAAGQLDVAEAAGIASTALTQFKLSGEDVPHVADLLAAGAGKAMGGVDDLGMALKQSGLVASQFGLSIEETTGGLAAFASQGLLGSDAGTSLKTMLLKLASPSKEAAGLMDELGIQAYNAQGKFVGLESLAGQLQTAFKGQSDASRDAAMATIFGTDAIRAANVLYQEGAQGVSDWTAAVDDSGYAARTAAELQDNLVGDLEKLGGSWSTLSITMGEVANGPLRGLTQGLTETLDGIAALPDPILGTITALGGIAGATALGAGGFALLLPKALETLEAFRSLGIALPDAEGKLKRFGKAAGTAAAAAVGITVLASAVEALGTHRQDVELTAAAVTRLVKSGEGVGALDAVFRDARDSTKGLTYNVNDLTSAAKQLSMLDPFSEWMDNHGVLNVIGGVTSDSKKLRDALGDIDTAISALDTDQAAAAFSQVYEVFEGQGVSIEKITEAFPKYTAKLQNAAAEAGYATLSMDQLEQIAASGEFPQYLSEVSSGIDSLTALPQDLAIGIDKIAESQENGTLTLDDWSYAARNSVYASEDAAKAYQEWVDNLGEGDAAFIDVLDPMNGLIEKQKEVATEAAEKSASTKDSWRDFYDGVSFSLESYLTDLEKQVTAQENWESNMIMLTGRASEGMIEHLASLGPEGAPLVQALVDGSDAELARMEAAFAQRGSEATSAFSESLINAGPVWEALAAVAGDKAVEGAKREVASGKKTLEDVVNQYNLSFNIKADTSAAMEATRAVIARINRMSASVRVGAYHANGLNAPIATGGLVGDVAEAYGLANGGVPRRRISGQLVEGAGTTTSDSIAAMLSRREFVQQAAAVDYYGVGTMYALNARMIPREALAPYGFADGGSPAYTYTPTVAPIYAGVQKPAPPVSLTLSTTDVQRIADAVREGSATGARQGIEGRDSGQGRALGRLR